MIWQSDNKTAILKDTTIIVFNDNGLVELYPSSKWIKPRNKGKHGFGHCQKFQFQTKEQAVAVFTELESKLERKNIDIAEEILQDIADCVAVVWLRTYF